MTDTQTLKQAAADHGVSELIARRFSPYAWLDRPVPDADLAAIFEAARWAASAFNEQPARYIVARKADEAAWGDLLASLVEGNQAWAQSAPVLALGVVSERFARNDKPNAVAEHDLGLASANLTLEATARGLYVHQMAGIQPEVARERFGIPEGFKAFTGIAIGYADTQTDNERDRTPRTRRPASESVFTGRWGDAAPFLR